MIPVRLRPRRGRRCASGSRASVAQGARAARAGDRARPRDPVAEYAKHTIAFAPKAVALLVVAWALAAGLGEWLPEAKPDEPHARWRNFLRRAAALVTVGLFRNVLFFLVPIWFASSTLGSVNMLAPIAAGGRRALLLLSRTGSGAAHARAPARPDAVLLVGPVRRAGAGGGGRDVDVAAAVGGARGAASRGSRPAWRRRARRSTTRVGRIELGAGALVAALVVRAGGAAAAAGAGRLHANRRSGPASSTARSKARPIDFPPAPSASTPGSPSTCRATTARGSASSGIATASRWATSPPREIVGGPRTGLPDVVVDGVAQTGLVAGRFADRRIPAHREETLRRRIA